MHISYHGKPVAEIRPIQGGKEKDSGRAPRRSGAPGHWFRQPSRAWQRSVPGPMAHAGRARSTAVSGRTRLIGERHVRGLVCPRRHRTQARLGVKRFEPAVRRQYGQALLVEPPRGGSSRQCARARGRVSFSRRAIWCRIRWIWTDFRPLGRRNRDTILEAGYLKRGGSVAPGGNALYTLPQDPREIGVLHARRAAAAGRRRTRLPGLTLRDRAVSLRRARPIRPYRTRSCASPPSRAAPGSAPPATAARSHPLLLPALNALPSGDAANAASSGLGAVGSARWSANPRRPNSHPTPVAPGPYVSQWSDGRMVWVSVSRARPDPSSETETSTQLKSSPNSQVRAKRDGRSQSVMTPPALPSIW